MKQIGSVWIALIALSCGHWCQGVSGLCCVTAWWPKRSVLAMLSFHPGAKSVPGMTLKLFLPLGSVPPCPTQPWLVLSHSRAPNPDRDWCSLKPMGFHPSFSGITNQSTNLLLKLCRINPFRSTEGYIRLFSFISQWWLESRQCISCMTSIFWGLVWLPSLVALYKFVLFSDCQTQKHNLAFDTFKGNCTHCLPLYT